MDILYNYFKYDTIRAGIDGSYRQSIGISSVAWRLGLKCGIQFIERVVMVPGALADQNLSRGEIGGQLGVISCIHHLEDIMGSSTLVKN